MSNPIGGFPPPPTPPPSSVPLESTGSAETPEAAETASTNTTAAASAANDTISRFDINDTNFSINSFFKMVSDSRLDFKENLHDIEFKEADFARKSSRDALSQTSNALLNYNKQLMAYRSQRVDAGNSDAATQGLNNQANATNTSISDSQQKAGSLNTETDAYNQEVDNFNQANQNGFPDQASRDAAIDQYNASAQSYNTKVQEYNASANVANASIDSYNLQVDAYNAQVDQNNAEIDAQNITRAQEGKDPLPHQPYETHKSHIPLKDEVALLPYADVTGPIPAAASVQIPSTIPAKPIPSNLDFFGDYLQPSFLPFFMQAMAYITSQRNIQELLLADRVRPNAGTQDITRPEAYIERRETHIPDASGGGAGASLASLALGLDHSRTDSILGKGAVDQLFSLFHVQQSPALVQLLQPFTLSMFVRSSIHGTLPGLGFLETNLSKQKPEDDAIRVASALGTNAAILGLINSDALKEPVAEAINNEAGINGLTEEQKLLLTRDIHALVSSAVLKLGLGSLVTETGSPTLLNAIDAALINTGPENATEQFAKVQGSFETLNTTYGSDTVGVLMGDFVTGTLTDRGYDAAVSQKIGSAAASDISEKGIPADYRELESRMQAIANASMLTESATDITNSVITFTLGASAKADLQSALISKVGPQIAPELTDQILLRVFGFSPDFNEPAIIQRQTEAGRPNSIESVIEDNFRTVNEHEDRQLASKLADEYGRANESTQELESFLREVIDPGQVLIGVMYEQSKGTAFERGWLDIPIG